MSNDEVLLDLADLFKVFSDSTRVKILCALLRAEMCVCDIAALLGMSKSAISHQLQPLPVLPGASMRISSLRRVRGNHGRGKPGIGRFFRAKTHHRNAGFGAMGGHPGPYQRNHQAA
ncbi:MAG: metalloregulator ArsR/SmtB family transcription factor [Treponema sp.]|nr:metalloregulator ArsR/SmtB family transcription factor [Treponema sp.]